MSKLMRVGHVSLDPDENKAIREEFTIFLEDAKEAGRVLKSLRKKTGLSLSELGQRVGWEPIHLAEMETGVQPIPVPLAKKLAEIFKVQIHELL